MCTSTMMRSVASFFLIQLVVVLVHLTHGFTVIHYCGPSRRLNVKSRTRIVSRPESPNRRSFMTLPIRPLLAGSNDDSSGDEESKNDASEGPKAEKADDTDSSALASDRDSAAAASETDSAPAAAKQSSEPESSKLTFRERLKKLWWKNDDSSLTTRQRLAKMGLAAVLSYGWVSNVSYAICISLAWYGFSKKTGLSPLAPDQWKPFLAVYAGFFVFNNVIRPLRLGLSIAISTYFDRVVAWVQRKTSLNKSLSIALVVFFFNIVGTISLMCAGITMASLASGVPIFPSKASLK